MRAEDDIVVKVEADLATASTAVSEIVSLLAFRRILGKFAVYCDREEHQHRF